MGDDMMSANEMFHGEKSMKSIICVPVATSQFLDVADFLREQGSDRDPVAVIGEAITQYLVLAKDDPGTFLHHEFDDNPKTESRGYLWKNKETHLFLPHGTEIRMRYRDRNYHARVEGDEIIYEGKSVSPANLANTITNTSRNAWRDLWIKKPDWKEWLLADHCRGMTATIGGKRVEL
jgi:hypothetical protein